MYEHERGRELSPLTPWLNLNYSISYICDKKKDRLASFGINLISGEIKEDFFHALQQRCLVKKLPHYQFVKQPHIPLPDAVKKTQRHVKNVLADEDQAWAREAETRLREEQDILRAYYRDEENEEEQRRRMQELEWQYRPQIDVQLVNAGLFYLT